MGVNIQVILLIILDMDLERVFGRIKHIRATGRMTCITEPELSRMRMVQGMRAIILKERRMEMANSLIRMAVFMKEYGRTISYNKEH